MTEAQGTPNRQPSQDLTGQVFGRLTVIGYAGRIGGSHRWDCHCQCGGLARVRNKDLKGGHTQSCGCLWEETFLGCRTTHGMTDTKLYRVWAHMKARCHNPKSSVYRYYGGRGVVVCERWQGKEGFANFLADMGPRPSSAHSIDRIDVNGNYEPGNCRWATKQEQMRNKRSNVTLTFRGETRCAAEWAELLGISYAAIVQRVGKLGWSDERALTTPVRDRGW